MSYKVTSLVLSHKLGSPTRKLILLAMADVANHDGTGVWLSNKTIASHSEVSKRCVINNVTALKGEGILNVVGKRPCLGGYTVEYSINIDAIKLLPEFSGEFSSPVHMNTFSGESGRTNECREVHPNHPRTVNKDTKVSIACKIPDGWSPNNNCRVFAEKKGMSNDTFDNEIEGFIEHAKGNERRQKNWDSAWRQWCISWVRNGSRQAGQRKTPNTQRGRASILDVVRDEYEASQRKGYDSDDQDHDTAIEGRLIEGNY